MSNDKKNNGAAHDAEKNKTSPLEEGSSTSPSAHPADKDGDNIDLPPAHLTDADKVAQLEQQLLEAKDKMLRAMADADNIKKRAFKDIEDGRKYAPQMVMREILPIFDNLSEAIKNISEEDKSQNSKIDLLCKSLELILKMAEGVFEKFMITKTANCGDKFDPNLHQALSTKPATEQAQSKDTIAEVLQQGYMIHDRLIRPALVVVFQ